MTNRTIRVSLGALLAVCIAAPAYAEPDRQLFKLVADTEIPQNAVFGAFVAISGNVAVVGAPDDCENGGFSGAAYIIDVTTGQQLFKLLADDGEQSDRFGAVAISGSRIVVGAALHRDHKAMAVSGAAYVFDAATGQQLYKLAGDELGFLQTGYLGWSVAMSGTIAVVGAPGHSSRAAFVYDITTGQKLWKLEPGEPAPSDILGQGDRFGVSVAVSGAIAVVGAPSDDDNGERSGSAYDFDTTTGQRLFKLLPDDGATLDQFGISVAVNGTRAVVGALFATNDNGDRVGAAYVFDVATGQQLFKLLSSDSDTHSRIGASVSLQGTTALVGTNWGTARVFDITTGQELFKLLAADIDGEIGDLFGDVVAMDGNIAVIGARGDESNGSRAGAAYIFDVTLPPNPADLNGDGCVNAADLAQLLGAWGTADLNGDGITNGADLAQLLGSWQDGCSRFPAPKNRR